MSKYQARAAMDQLVGRPAFVAQSYAGQITDANSEVTSGGMMADIRELANAVPADEIAAYGDRCALLASTYGFDAVDDEKPFVFSNGYALIPIHGILINRFSYSWGFVTGYNFIRNQVAAAIADDDVTAIVFDVNSNGGMVSGCGETADFLFDCNEANGGKTMIGVIDANCHSAAYYIISQCDHIAMTPSGSCANVGVLQVHFDISKMLANDGVKVSLLFAGSHKVDGNSFEPLSAEVRAEFQVEIDAAYDTFVAAVARGRGLDEQVVRDTEARMYGATDALALGLIDAVQNPSDAVEAYFNADNDTDDDDDNEAGDDPEDDPPEKQESNMAHRPVTPTTQTRPAAPAAAAAVTEVTSDTATTDVAARTAERVRISSIQTHAEAVGREPLAQHLALNTDLDVDTATSILAASPKATAPVVETAAATQTAAVTVPAVAAAAPVNHFAHAMDNTANPNVGTSATATGVEGEVTPANRILATQARFSGATTATKH